MKNESRSSLVLGLIILGLLTGGAVRGDLCNFDSSAVASITGSPGWVTTDHFGEVTNFDCEVTPRRFVLETKALHDNRQEYFKVLKIADPVELGQIISHQKTIATCSGVWVGTTRSGYQVAGINTWKKSAASGPYFMNCLPDDPPPGCEGPYEDTVTWRLTRGEAPGIAATQLGLALERTEQRVEGSFLMDDWALLSTRGGTVGLEITSRRTMADAAARTNPSSELDRFDRVLLVQAARHADNRRWTPVPELEPLETWLPEGLEGDFWFRAEVDESGSVDRLMILESGNVLADRDVRRALSGELRLSYVDHRRHRAVVFGIATLASNGRLRVADALVILPQCCCGVDDILCM